METTRRRARLLMRFWAKYELPSEPGGCWTWKAATTRGYGTFGLSKSIRSFYAHRMAWLLLGGPIPTGFEIDHKCRNKLCGNTAHLEPVTKQENMRRAAPFRDPARNGGGAKERAKTHCPAGHDYAGPHGKILPNGWRHCKACDLARHNAKYAAKKKEQAVQ